MSKLNKIGADIWFDLDPSESLYLRQGPALTWFGPREQFTATGVKAVGAGVKNRALKLPVIETKITVAKPMKMLARVGTKVEVWELELGDKPVFFKGAFYLGHKGDITLTARKLNAGDLLFMVEPKGTGKVYLAFPKNVIGLPLNGKTVCTPSDTIALIIGQPEFKNEGLKAELRDLLKKGAWTRGSSSEISQAEEIYIYGGSVKSLFSSSSDEEIS